MRSAVRYLPKKTHRFKTVVGLCFVSVFAISTFAGAATKCVNTSGTAGCYSSISAAVAAASANDTIKVQAGTYKDFVKITIPLSLIGASPYTTFIDATGQPNAVYVNNGSGLVSDVVIAGFTLENANYEGVLLNGATSATIRNNHIVNNDKILQPSDSEPSCPNLTTVYPFEGNEQDDCGEGLHLTNVSSSVVDHNIVENNAGGILITDDSGPTFGNSIRDNTVRNNVIDCGITLASHTPFGVFHNTVSNNLVAKNGTEIALGGGAGVGLFSPGGPTANYGNAVVNNRLVGNGIAGVALHTHAPGTERLQDETIVGNYIARNGADGDLGLAQGQGDGIAILVTGGTIGGIVISDNTFADEAEDIAIATNVAIHVTATLNNLTSNGIGVDNLGPAPGFSGSPAVTRNATVNAKENWWGCSAGPGAPGCSTVVNAVSSGALASTVLFVPWLNSPVPESLFTTPWAP